MVKVVRDALSTQLTNRERSLSSAGGATGSLDRRNQRVGGTKTAKLLFANKTEKDILWKEELSQITKTNKGR